jgi:HlyD family secretion protein
MMARFARKHVVLAALVVGAGLVALVALRPTTYDAEVVTVGRGLLRVTVDETAVTRMRHHAEVAAPVSGRVAECCVRVGDSVSPGMVVARVYPAPLDPRTREQAEAALASARSLREEAVARVQQARVTLDEARRARGRAAHLAEAGALATSELERAVDEERIRARELDAASARADAAAQDERRARLALVGADPENGASTPVLLRAAMSGTVLRVFEEHDRVVAAGTPLLEIGDPASLEIVIDVLTSDAAAIRSGALVLVSLGGPSPLRAHVTRIEPAAFTKVSPLGVEEQRVNALAAFDSPPPGVGDQFEAEVSIVVWERADALKVPVGALVRVPDGWRVFVGSGNRARLRAVEVGQRGTQEAEVLEGLEAGERVVLHPDERLRDGSRIRTVVRR